MDSKTYDELHGSTNWVGLLDPLDLGLRNLLLGYGDLTSAAARAFNSDKVSPYNGYSYYGKSSFFKGAMLPWAESKYDVTSFIYATATVNPVSFFRLASMPREGSLYDSNWMGYIAVSNDEYTELIGRREICVVWRGTLTFYEWADDIVGVEPVPASPLFHANDTTFVPRKEEVPIKLTGDGEETPKIMRGWLMIYNTSNPDSHLIKTSARTQLLTQIKKLLIKYKDEKVSITCTGHSLGACLAVLSAFDLARNAVTPDINVSAFIFGSPQVGNQSFKDKMEELPNLKVLRVKNDPDLIPFWPSKILKAVKNSSDEIPSWLIRKMLGKSISSDWLIYVDVGVEILIDSNKSPYLKEKSELKGIFNDESVLHDLEEFLLTLSGSGWLKDVINEPLFHSLEGMLHTLSGWNGKNGEFNWNLVKRSLGLVNMYYDYLKPEFKIPANWWSEKNKRMVLNEYGDWVKSPLILDLSDHDLPGIP